MCGGSHTVLSWLADGKRWASAISQEKGSLGKGCDSKTLRGTHSRPPTARGWGKAPSSSWSRPTARSFSSGESCSRGWFEVCNMEPYSGQLRQWPRCAVAAGRGAEQAGAPFLHCRRCLRYARDAAAAVRDPCALLRPDPREPGSSRRHSARTASLPGPGERFPHVLRHPKPPHLLPLPSLRRRALFLLPLPAPRERLWSPPPPPATLLKPFAILQGPQVGAAADGVRYPYFWGSLHP